MAKHQRYRWQGNKRHVQAPQPEVRHEEPRFVREPMTKPQSEYLTALCEGLNMPFDPGWSKSRASREITRMNKLRRLRQMRRTGG